ncbi:sulfatase family protein [Halomontanus rarus]|uniref:sulfatase family protein n=1 Tax=Halomontanus rarus TaxID=3034020 RepID=UPI0023E7C105|nr:sulfatase [Halovivax sp. TS33]
MSSQVDDRPNVLLMHSHDLGRHLGCYGRGVETPAIDSITRDGVQFDEYYCTAPQCGPSRSSIMTGRHPHDNGLMGHHWLGWGLHDDVETMPGLLREAGYTTAVYGVQHVGPDPDEIGYDTSDTGNVSADELATRVVSYLEEDRDSPFFASVGFFEPHRLGPDHRRGFHAPEYDASDPDEITVPEYLPDIDVVRDEIAGFQGMIRAVDEAVGEILASLEGEGLADETLIIFTTDHGIAMPRAKGMCYDPGIETTLVARYPGLFEGGTRYDSLLSNVDLMPTILDVAGVDGAGDVAGRSFLPLVRGDEYDERERIFVEMTFHDKYNPVRGVRTDRYKYLRSFDDQPEVYLPQDILFGPSGLEFHYEYYSESRPEEELYDLKADPLERENLVDDPDYETAADELRQAVDNWMEDTDDPLLDGDVHVPKEHVEMLKTSPW